MDIRTLTRFFLMTGLFFVSLAMLNNAFGKHRRVTSTRGLEDAVRIHELAVALFYVEKRGIDRDIRDKVREANKVFRAVSKVDTYDYAGILFAGVNTAKEDILEMTIRYGVTRPEPESPSLALFRGGKMVACLSGFQDREDIKNIIDQYFGGDITRITKEKDAQRQRRLEAARVRAYEYAAAYPYWGGWPYYGGWAGYGAAWPYYGGSNYWGPSWGGGIGFSGGWSGGGGGGYRHGGGHRGGHHGGGRRH